MSILTNLLMVPSIRYNTSSFFLKTFDAMINSIISDLGKVLINFDNSIFLKKMVEFTSFSFHEISSFVADHREIIRAFDSGKLTPSGFYNQVVKILKADISYGHFYRIYNDIFSLNQAAVDIMAKAKTSCRMVLLSNTDEMRFGFIKKTFPEVLFFDEYVLSYQEGCMKPDFRIYRVAVQKAHAPADQCVFIDDRRENIEAAEELGIHAVHYHSPAALEAELSRLGVLSSKS